MRKILILLSVILLLSCNGSHNEKKDYSNFDSTLAQKEANEKKAEEAWEEELRKSFLGYWKSDDGEVELAIYEDKIILIVDEILECKAASWEYTCGLIEFDDYSFNVYCDYEENKINYIEAGDYKLKKHSVDKISYYSSREEKYGSSSYSSGTYNNSYSRGDNYSWIDGKWNATNTFSGQDMYGFYHGAIYIELHINYNNRTVKVYMAKNNTSSPMTVARGIQYSLIYNGSFSIDTYNNELNCGRGGNYKLDAESRKIYNNGSDGRINFYRGSKM